MTYLSAPIRTPGSLRRGALALGAALLPLLTLPACGTKEIAASGLALTSAPSETNQGGFALAMAVDADNPSDEQARVQTNLPFYEVHADGVPIFFHDGDAEPVALMIAEGVEASVGYLAAASHTIQLIDPSGRTIFSGGPYDIQAGHVSRLFLGGPIGALTDTFVSFPSEPAAGITHVTLVNLIRPAQPIELVSCPGASASDCAPIADPVAYGQVTSVDLSLGLTPANGFLPAFLDLQSGIGYRVVPDARRPVPPVLEVRRDVLGWNISADGLRDVPNYVAAPLIMFPEGSPFSEF